ncbi:MAG: glycosyl transferase [Methanobacterium sp. Maddingley MBC34]|nr:MAG: glycosyl transferase [Methanobacterium sp. Maddingley MBC34]
MRKPSVNILIFTYNQENLVKDTLESVINQSYENINRIIVADDGSTDKTPEIIKEYALNNPSIEPVLAKENKGIAYNMNRALKRADGDYVSFLDGDDMMYHQKIEKQVKYLTKNPDLVACTHDVDVFDSCKEKSLGKFSEVIGFNKIPDRITIKSFFDPSLILCPSSTMYRYEKIPCKGLETRLKYWYDFLFGVEVLMKGDIGFMDEILGMYRLHGANATQSQDMKELGLENALLAYSIIISRYPELYPLVKKRRNATYVSKILECIKKGDVNRAKKLSRVLMSEGSFIKGMGSYILSNVLNEKRVDSLLSNKGLLNFILKHF